MQTEDIILILLISAIVLIGAMVIYHSISYPNNSLEQCTESNSSGVVVIFNSPPCYHVLYKNFNSTHYTLIDKNDQYITYKYIP